MLVWAVKIVLMKCLNLTYRVLIKNLESILVTVRNPPKYLLAGTYSAAVFVFKARTRVVFSIHMPIRVSSQPDKQYDSL